jgi:hypothetical protein
MVKDLHFPISPKNDEKCNNQELREDRLLKKPRDTGSLKTNYLQKAGKLGFKEGKSRISRHTVTPGEKNRKRGDNEFCRPGKKHTEYCNTFLYTVLF